MPGLRDSALAAAALLALAAAPALAQRTLNVGASSAPTGMDPHYHSSNMNNAQLRQMFDLLIDLDASGAFVPRLAESWRAVDDRTWEFRLREGVRFHDGTPFTAEDVAFSYARVPTVPNSPAPFTPAVRLISRVEVVDPRTIRFHTREPHPVPRARHRGGVHPVAHASTPHATLADFNGGRAMVGTGPYRFVSYAIGERLEITRNPTTWGPAQPWDRVITRFISNAGARVGRAAVGRRGRDRLRPRAGRAAAASANRASRCSAWTANTTSYIMPDAMRDTHALRDRQAGPAAGAQPAARRPRAPGAVAWASTARAIVERLLNGQGAPADQFAAPALQGRAPGLPPLPFDPDRARRAAGRGRLPGRLPHHHPRPERLVPRRCRRAAGDRAGLDAHRHRDAGRGAAAGQPVLARHRPRILDVHDDLHRQLRREHAAPGGDDARHRDRRRAVQPAALVHRPRWTRWCRRRWSPWTPRSAMR